MQGWVFAHGTSGHLAVRDAHSVREVARRVGGDPEELVSMVVELVTNCYMNAEVVRVDGGIRMPPK